MYNKKDIAASAFLKLNIVKPDGFLHDVREEKSKDKEYEVNYILNVGLKCEQNMNELLKMNNMNLNNLIYGTILYYSLINDVKFEKLQDITITKKDSHSFDFLAYLK